MSDSDGVSELSCLLTVRSPNQTDLVKASKPDKNTDRECGVRQFIVYFEYLAESKMFWYDFDLITSLTLVMKVAEAVQHFKLFR